VVGWDGGDEGLLAWIGGILMIVAFFGLIALQFLKERTTWRRDSFFFDPYWKYGLLAVFLGVVFIEAVVGLEGDLLTFAAALFWLSLIALIVQMAGRWIQRWRGRSALARRP
jgi:hypothetical protein